MGARVGRIGPEWVQRTREVWTAIAKRLRDGPSRSYCGRAKFSTGATNRTRQIAHAAGRTALPARKLGQANRLPYVRRMTPLVSSSRRSGLPPGSAVRLAAWLLPLFLGALPACTTHHWAEVANSTLPPPAGPKVLHTTRLHVHVLPSTGQTQCLSHQDYRPLCYFNVRPAIEAGLERNLWPAFPEVALGQVEQAEPGDYVLEVDLDMDALPPDASGPGWSAGVRGRYRLLRDGQTRFEGTLATRSRAEFPYGAPLGTGASEAMDAALQHIAREISQVEESQPAPDSPLPRVSSRIIPMRKTAAKAPRAEPAKPPLAAPAAKSAKTDAGAL
jgi:hypothetical protein